VEASKVMGQEITSSKDTSRAISDLYNKLTGIRPSKVELDLLKALQSKELQKFRADLKKTKGWLSAGQFKVDKTLEPAMVAANAVVASVILNSDATLTKR
jgi:regulator of sigma D